MLANSWWPVTAKEHNLDNLWFNDQVHIRGHGYCNKDSRRHQYTVETRMIEQCSMSLGFPLLVWSRDFCYFCFGRGKGAMFLMCFFASFPQKGILAFIEHGSIIRVFTVCEGASRSGEVFDFHESIHGWAGEVIVPRLRRAAATSACLLAHKRGHSASKECLTAQRYFVGCYSNIVTAQGKYVGYHTVKTWIIGRCAMKSRIPFSGKGAKTQQKHGPFPPSETEKNK